MIAREEEALRERMPCHQGGLYKYTMGQRYDPRLQQSAFHWFLEDFDNLHLYVSD
jgi:hypothetical protein